MVGPPPALDPGTVDDQDGLPDGEGAVVPDNEKHAQLVQHHEVKEVGGNGQDPTQQVDDQLELLILLLVLVFLVPVQDIAVYIAKDCPQVSTRFTWQHLESDFFLQFLCHS